jgi:hypothetical protein
MKTIGLAIVKNFGTALLGGIILVLALALGIASLPFWGRDTNGQVSDVEQPFPVGALVT